MEKENKKEIFPKILEMKEIISEKIKTFEDYNVNKAKLLSLITQIESILNPELNNNNNQEIPKKDEPQENIIDKEIIKENSIHEKSINNNIDNINNNKKEENEAIEENNLSNNDNNINNNNYNQEEDESEKHSLPKLNFDYDKNINDILNNINIQGQNEIINNNEMTQEKNKKITNIQNIQNNGYSNLFSFNQDLSSTEDFTSKKTRIYNSNIKEKDNINNISNNILNENNININNINNINDNSIQSEENIYKNNSIQYENNEPEKDQNEINNINNIKNQNNSKALRVADIIMKLNSNDILYDIISQLYSKEILEQLMSPNVDINLINIIEQTIEKITVLENEEIQKLKNKESSIISTNNKDYNEIKDKDEYLYHELNKKNNNNNIYNYNKVNNIPKKVSEYKKYKSSSSFYDKNNKNNSINSNSSVHYQNYFPKNKKISSKNKLKELGVHLNSEILQNYPKTGKTILGYEKFKRDKNREFNFERSLRNDNYEENVLNKRNYNLNISKADSIKNQSHYSINGNSNNRSMSNKKMIFNNYTSPFGDYFDSSLQKGGESKLVYYNNKKRGMFKNARSPVKDYIDGLNEVYI